MTTTTVNKDLVEIIEACGKNGVSHIKMGDVEITFNGFVIQTESDYPTKVEPVGQNIQVDPNLKIQQDYEEISDEIEHQIITDPYEYEQSLFKDELEDSDTHTDEIND